MVNVKKLIQAKKRGQKWAMLTAYDALTSSLLESEGVDWILVGDSVGMVLLGYASTTDVTMDEMIHHASAVRRGAPKSFIIGDMPLAALSKGPAHALACAKRFIREAGCDAVKVEWRKDAIAITKKLLQNKIPVMGHVGLTPQSVKKGESFRVRGKAAGEAAAVYESALAFEKAGTFSVLVECVPEPVGQAIARALKTPVIGIGAGRYCDGQVLVFHDLAGIFTKFRPRFVKRYFDADAGLRVAARKYVQEVHSGGFPQEKHGFGMEPSERKIFLEKI
jgi:3-methyl-2-oxobutanoate hydroxymethyltransferase